MELTRGIIIRSQSGFYTVKTDEGIEVTAHIRGRFKQGPKTGDILAVGDWVKLSPQDDGKYMIEEIEPRTSKLARLAPTARGEYEQIIIANPDQVVFVFSCADPAPKMRMLDRFLIIAEQQDIPPLIVANKVDLIGMRKAKKLFGHYPKIGYPVFYTSAMRKEGIRNLRKHLNNKISVFAGPSGVGKSSLLNVIQPRLGLEVSEISQATRKGRHTTTVRGMFPLVKGGYVADTPGLKSLGLWDIEPEELDGYFPEIAPLVASCEYNNCTHFEEPGCAVIAAVESGEIHPDRYESFVRLRYGEDNR
ncbi:MAG: ribosome small subunit-dependent GTPase A [Chloroflexota bacterium]